MLEAGKEVVFNPEDDDFEHQLDLRMVRTLRSKVKLPPSSRVQLVCFFFFCVSIDINGEWSQ